MTAHDFVAEYRKARDHQAALNAENRALVLRYPDIAKRLCEPPYGATNPANWTGYIPGALGAENSRGVVSLNISSVRAQLLELVTEAAQRADHEQPEGAS